MRLLQLRERQAGGCLGRMCCLQESHPVGYNQPHVQRHGRSEILFLGFNNACFRQLLEDTTDARGNPIANEARVAFEKVVLKHLAESQFDAGEGDGEASPHFYHIGRMGIDPMLQSSLRKRRRQKMRTGF